MQSNRKSSRRVAKPEKQEPTSVPSPGVEDVELPDWVRETVEMALCYAKQAEIPFTVFIPREGLEIGYFVVSIPPPGIDRNPVAEDIRGKLQELNATSCLMVTEGYYHTQDTTPVPLKELEQLASEMSLKDIPGSREALVFSYQEPGREYICHYTITGEIPNRVLQGTRQWMRQNDAAGDSSRFSHLLPERKQQ